jgi:hypothetical protein
MRSTMDSALDPTRASSSASPPPPVRPPLHLAPTPVLFWPPHDSLLRRYAPTAGEAKYALRPARELFGNQEVRTTVSDGSYADPHNIPWQDDTNRETDERIRDVCTRVPNWPHECYAAGQLGVVFIHGPRYKLSDTTGKGGGLTCAGPSKRPDRARRPTTPNVCSPFLQIVGLRAVACWIQNNGTPGTVRLWESPGRAGGLPK